MNQLEIFLICLFKYLNKYCIQLELKNDIWTYKLTKELWYKEKSLNNVLFENNESQTNKVMQTKTHEIYSILQ